jgi:RNA polymerase sigma-70 factor (ECF subfamily)
MRLTDGSVADLARSRDDRDISALTERYMLTVWRLAWRITENEDDADEVVQQTFIRVWAEWASFRGRSGVETWLTSIAVNCAIDRLRVRLREREMFTPLGDRDAESPEPGAERLLWSIDARKHVAGVMGRLSGVERMTYSLHYLEGMPVAQIAGLLGVEESAVWSALHRAIKKLRSGLKPLMR